MLSWTGQPSEDNDIAPAKPRRSPTRRSAADGTPLWFLLLVSIVVPGGFYGAAIQLVEAMQLRREIEVLVAEQLISTSLNGMARFVASDLKVTTRKFVEKYNEIIAAVESDQSLKIELG